ncbi:MAG: 16S rRNA processing protein RimM [Proteobacteria bacterium]|nr:16S rRNA processing protein RimM [Pseudomonadota bacterium]
MKPERLICVGQILGAHGVKGEVKLKSFTLNPRDILRYAPLCDEKAMREFALKIRGGVGAVFIATLTGVADRTMADKLKGVKLFAPAQRRPKPGKGRFYLDDLPGLAAVDEKGKAVGKVTGVFNFGAGDILAVENEAGREWLLPFKKPFAAKPDMEKSRIEVNIPEDYPFSQKAEKKVFKKKHKHKNGHAREGGHPRKTTEEI